MRTNNCTSGNMQNKQSGAGKFLDPENIIAQLNLLPGSSVADFGCGSGYFSVPLAEAIGSEGIMHALDILPSALESVASKAKIAEISNIVTKRANLENEKGSGLNDESQDLVVLKDMLFQNSKKEVIIKEAFRVLKQGGRLLVVEWNNREKAIGPDAKLRIAKADAAKMVEKQGFKNIADISAGEFHYAFVAQK